MKTLGIDLASQPLNTTACMLGWTGKCGRVVTIESRCDDGRLDALATRADAIGVDAPFGWPVQFCNAVSEWTHATWTNALRDDLTLRLTDRWVVEKLRLYPLRVAADRIAIPAMRAMALLHRYGITDRSGAKSGRFFEVYPAASLKAWALTSTDSYKKKTAPSFANRQRILVGLRERFSIEVSDSIANSDHTLDALIAAITARLAKIGTTYQPSLDLLDIVRREGWIHVPNNDATKS